ncbi:nitric oxide reductase activation protein [Hahella sp. CCB-MM4]|uniref:nitric oxide reductase activation protein NorD n=1 Tax=Hahella sp. (strain CCB-MM4) TaxID=1926491 RepID=UPI000B9BCD03|nr:VWA domain-containing protein [Hahella sp. CCB-MM4]OZG72966.1 nitric oxide reductase activation protein [Hahella sp. CCB-MM4]
MFEVEEWVGNLWHRLATRYADSRYPQAKVTLEEVRKEVGIIYRAMGGVAGVRIEAAVERPLTVPKTLMQRVAGSQRKIPLPYLDDEVLALPEEIAVFPDRTHNYDLYIFLASLAAQPSLDEDFVVDSCTRISRMNRVFPSMAARYQEMVEAYLSLRMPPEQLPDPMHHREKAIWEALRNPASCQISNGTVEGLLPVPFWLYPSLRHESQAPRRQGLESDSRQRDEQEKVDLKHSSKKARSEYVDDHEGDKGLLVFRLENLFSWSEYLQLDRTADDSPEDDAERTAEDLDHLSLSRQEYGGSKRIRIDLDLPSAQEDDTPLGSGIWLPEWDYRKQQLIQDHCCVQPMFDHRSRQSGVPDRLRCKVRDVRAQFEQLRPMRYWQRNQSDGEEIELDRWHDFCADKKAGHTIERPMYRSFSGRLRDLDCLLLADLSMSTDAYVDNHRRIIDIIADALLLFSEALDSVGDRFALYGFSSRKRQHVRFNIIKNFSEPYTDTIRGRIMALKPGFYTRIGAAIRQAVSVLEDQCASRRLLLILTDGKPNDVDLYEGRYGLEDTREAVLEARRRGLIPFCITVDREANQYLPYLFGDKGYALVNNIEQLPQELPRLYSLLVGQ